MRHWLERAMPAAALAATLGTHAPAQGAPAHQASDPTGRRAVSVTVYNANFALVREVRDVKGLPKGPLELEFRGVAATIQPATVAVRPSGPGAPLRILEQNYRYDLLSPETLLEKYVGRNVRAYRYHEARGEEDSAEARLLSVTGGPILQIGSEVTFNYPGRLAFPEVPPNLIAKPTLVWLVDSPGGDQALEVSYLADQMSWSADYVMVLDQSETRASLTGWVTLVNNSGASYTGATLKLVAGDVNRVQPEMVMAKAEGFGRGRMASAPAFREEGLLDYHLYSLERPTDVLDREQKQVTLLEAGSVAVEKKLVLPGQSYWYQGRQGELGKNQKVSVFIDFLNTAQNRLGIPLPKGTVRLYKADQSRAQQFVGEDAIDHTPRDEKVHLRAGEAFDVVADRTQVSWSALSNCSSESVWRIELRNHKDEDVRVEVREPAGGDWKITSSTLPAVRDDAQNFHFDVPVTKRSSAEVKYTVRVRWC